MATDKNNSCHPGATAPGFKIAARLRGEKEDVVFTSCTGCFQKNLQARISFVEKETTMTTDKNNSCHPGASAFAKAVADKSAPGFKIAARLRG